MLFKKAFDTFLAEEVNLNKSRIDTLVNRVTAIEGFITASSWQPTITRYSRQGSWGWAGRDRTSEWRNQNQPTLSNIKGHFELWDKFAPKHINKLPAHSE